VLGDREGVGVAAFLITDPGLFYSFGLRSERISATYALASFRARNPRRIAVAVACHAARLRAAAAGAGLRHPLPWFRRRLLNVLAVRAAAVEAPRAGSEAVAVGILAVALHTPAVAQGDSAMVVGPMGAAE